MASLAFPVAGAAIGAAVPGVGVALGWSIGSFVGNLVADKGSIEGPRLGDLSVQSSAYGVDIPRVLNRSRLAGNVIWSTDKIPVEHSSGGGKGGLSSGPSQSSYTYRASYAVLFCLGDHDGDGVGQGVGILTLWRDGKLFMKLEPGASIAEIQESNRRVQGISIYVGGKDQLPDAVIQSYAGIDNTQGYIGQFYIVIENDDLGTAGVTPRWEAEVLMTGTGSGGGELLYIENNDLAINRYSDNFTPILRDGYLSVVSPYETGTFQSTPDPTDYPGGQAQRFDESLNYLIDVPYSFPPGYNEDFNGEVPLASFFQGYLGLQGVWVNRHTDAQWLLRIGNQAPLAAMQTGDQFVADLPKLWGVATQATRGKMLVMARDPDDSNDYLYMYDNGGALLFKAPLGYDIFTNAKPTYWIHQGGSTLYPMVLDGRSGQVNGSNHMTLSEDGQYVWFSKYGVDSLHYRFRIDDAAGLQLVDQLEGSITGDAIASIELGGILYTFNALKPFAQPYVTRLNAVTPQQFYSRGSMGLDEAVSTIMGWSGYAASQYDVTDLAGTEIRGMKIARVMSGRKMLEPLMAAYQFDAVESGSKIVFVKRGGAPVAVLTAADFIDTPEGKPALVEHDRLDEQAIPSQLTVQYISDDLAYQPGAQPAKRINYLKENHVTVELPLVLSENEGRQTANILLQQYNTEREKFRFQLGPAHLGLKPTDVVTIPIHGRQKNVRLTRRVLGDGILTFDAVADNPRDYTSTATAPAVSPVDNALDILSPTDLLLLDAPLLNNADDYQGLYAVAAAASGSWPGCQIYSGTDGVSFDPVGTLTSQGTWGYCRTVLPDHTSELKDTTSSVTVNLLNDAGNLASTTDAGLIQGANYALIGSEVIAFQTVNANSDGSVTLTGFLRGRRGTAWATGSHGANEPFVLLTASQLTRLPASVNQSRYYKAATFGYYLDAVDSQQKTNTGVALTPFAPHSLSASRDGSNNLSLAWGWQSRYVESAFYNRRPLFEDTEAGEVDVMDGETVLRTISTTSAAASYTSAEQTADGLTPGDPVTVRVYQLSGTVGRGYPLEKTV